jgi:methyl-accepting chemotaxis protein
MSQYARRINTDLEAATEVMEEVKTALADAINDIGDGVDATCSNFRQQVEQTTDHSSTLEDALFAIEGAQTALRAILERLQHANVKAEQVLDQFEDTFAPLED